MKKSINNFETNASMNKQSMNKIIGGVNGKGHTNNGPKPKYPVYGGSGGGHVTILK